jgi:cell division protein ZipA
VSDELRWILLGFGALLLAWIYLADKWRTRRSGSPAPASSHTQLEDAAGHPIAVPAAATASPATVPIASGSTNTVPIDWTVPLPEPATERLEAHEPSAPAVSAERRVGERHRRWLPSLGAQADTDTQPVDPARRVSAQEPRKIVTLRLLALPSFEGQDVQAALEAVELQFGKHAIYHRLTAEGHVVFSVASMTEPGSFDIERLAQTRLAGLILYALLPGPLDGPATFTQLLNAATQLQQAIGGDLQDERGVPLTSYRINRIREEVSKFRAGLS